MRTLVSLSFLCMFAASPARATVVSWNPAPGETHGTADSTGHTFVTPGSSIQASGYTVGWPSHTPLGPYYENNGFSQTAPDVVGRAGRQWQENEYLPTQFTQFDVSPVLAQGVADGPLSGAMIPVTFQSTLTPVPEIGALFPIIGLIAAVAVTQILRRRRIARLGAASPAKH